ncbi:MAG: hypothetical protein LBT08_01635, partial [Synergistaceae bacterium]|nr:hypothetical protein [Synergistaceae bacterium]
CDSGTITGDSRIYAIDLRSGAAKKWEDGSKYLTLQNVKITGMTYSKQGKKGRVFVTYNKLTGENNLDTLHDKNVSHVTTFDMDAAVIDVSHGGERKLSPGETVIYYWLSK